MCYVHVSIFFDSCLLFSSKGEPVNKEDIFVAVKTCQKFHSERGESHSYTEDLPKMHNFPFERYTFVCFVFL